MDFVKVMSVVVDRVRKRVVVMVVVVMMDFGYLSDIEKIDERRGSGQGSSKRASTPKPQFGLVPLLRLTYFRKSAQLFTSKELLPTSFR